MPLFSIAIKTNIIKETGKGQQVFQSAIRSIHEWCKLNKLNEIIFKQEIIFYVYMYTHMHVYTYTHSNHCVILNFFKLWGKYTSNFSQKILRFMLSFIRI